MDTSYIHHILRTFVIWIISVFPLKEKAPKVLLGNVKLGVSRVGGHDDGVTLILLVVDCYPIEAALAPKGE